MRVILSVHLAVSEHREMRLNSDRNESSYCIILPVLCIQSCQFSCLLQVTPDWNLL